jgi:hypothetical protein
MVAGGVLQFRDGGVKSWLRGLVGEEEKFDLLGVDGFSLDVRELEIERRVCGFGDFLEAGGFQVEAKAGMLVAFMAWGAQRGSLVDTKRKSGAAGVGRRSHARGRPVCWIAIPLIFLPVNGEQLFPGGIDAQNGSAMMRKHSDLDATEEAVLRESNRGKVNPPYRVGVIDSVGAESACRGNVLIAQLLQIKKFRDGLCDLGRGMRMQQVNRFVENGGGVADCGALFKPKEIHEAVMAPEEHVARSAQSRHDTCHNIVDYVMNALHQTRRATEGIPGIQPCDMFLIAGSRGDMLPTEEINFWAGVLETWDAFIGVERSRDGGPLAGHPVPVWDTDVRLIAEDAGFEIPEQEPMPGEKLGRRVPAKKAMDLGEPGDAGIGNEVLFRFNNRSRVAI